MFHNSRQKDTPLLNSILGFCFLFLDKFFFYIRNKCKRKIKFKLPKNQETFGKHGQTQKDKKQNVHKEPDTKIKTNQFKYIYKSKMSQIINTPLFYKHITFFFSTSNNYGHPSSSSLLSPSSLKKLKMVN